MGYPPTVCEPSCEFPASVPPPSYCGRRGRRRATSRFSVPTGRPVPPMFRPFPTPIEPGRTGPVEGARNCERPRATILRHLSELVLAPPRLARRRNLPLRSQLSPPVAPPLRWPAEARRRPNELGRVSAGRRGPLGDWRMSAPLARGLGIGRSGFSRRQPKPGASILGLETATREPPASSSRSSGPGRSGAYQLKGTPRPGSPPQAPPCDATTFSAW